MRDVGTYYSMVQLEAVYIESGRNVYQNNMLCMLSWYEYENISIYIWYLDIVYSIIIITDKYFRELGITDS